MLKDSIQHGPDSHQLEQESKAHDQRVGWQEVLSASDHEGPHCQILACRSSLRDLSNTQPLSISVLLLSNTCFASLTTGDTAAMYLAATLQNVTTVFMSLKQTLCKVAAADSAAAVSPHEIQTTPLPDMPSDATKCYNVGGPHLMLMDPPGRSHDLGIPGRAAADACTAGLGNTQWGNSFFRHMVFDNGGGGTMQISMHI